MAVLEVRRGAIGFLAPLAPFRFRILDSQPEKSNMGPVPTDVHDFRLFQKSYHGFLTRYLLCFRPNRPTVGFWSFSAGTKKMRHEKLLRFVVVSPRECLLCLFRALFKILFFRSKVRSFSDLRPLETCTLIVSINRFTQPLRLLLD